MNTIFLYGSNIIFDSSNQYYARNKSYTSKVKFINSNTSNSISYSKFIHDFPVIQSNRLNINDVQPPVQCELATPTPTPTVPPEPTPTPTPTP